MWVWSTQAASTGVLVKVSAATAQNVGAPDWAVCPSISGATCKLGNLPVGQADELEATEQIQPQAAAGELVTLTAAVSATGAYSYASTAADAVVPNTGATPAATLPIPATLPTIPGTGISPSNPAGLFPTVGASPTTGTGSLGLPPAQGRAALHATNDAAAVPLDAKLLGGQLAGLAVLAGAITIAIARLSLRKPKTTSDEPNANRPPAR
jgi:hypothetical protein